MACHSSADRVSVTGWSPITSPIWFSAGHSHILQAVDRGDLAALSPSGSASSLWYCRSFNSVAALAAGLCYWRHSSLLVSVIRVVQEAVCSPGSQQVCHLTSLRRAARIRTGADPLRLVYCWFINGVDSHHTCIHAGLWPLSADCGNYTHIKHIRLCWSSYVLDEIQ